MLSEKRKLSHKAESMENYGKRPTLWSQSRAPPRDDATATRARITRAMHRFSHSPSFSFSYYNNCLTEKCRGKERIVMITQVDRFETADELFLWTKECAI